MDVAKAMTASPAGGPFLTETMADADDATDAAGLEIAVLDGATSTVKTLTIRTDTPPELRHRHAALVEEAGVRAEHQDQARLHMLALAAALEESSRQRRELQVLLKREHQTTADQRRMIDELDCELDKANVHEDARKMGMLESGFKTHQVSFLAALLWSRQVVPRCVLLGEDAVEEEFVSAGEVARRCAEAQLSPGPNVKSLLSPSNAATPKGAEGPELPGEDGDEDGDGVAKFLGLARPPGTTTPTKGDELTMLWFIKLWRHHVSAQNKMRGEEKQKREEKAKEEAIQAKIKADLERAMEAERKISGAMSQQLEKTKENLFAQERKQQHMEEEHHDLRRRFAIVAVEHETEKQALQVSIAEAKILAAKREADLDEARQAIASQKEIIEQAEQRLENEKEKMKKNLRELGAQLQQAEIMAKHMRETALKAKREAASSVPPERFAQLMAELEEMREKLVAMGKDCILEHAGNVSLTQKLEQNSRRLELERQFLPLLRKVRGPVGPKNPLLCGKSRKASTSTPQLELGAPDKLRMGQSQSARLLDTRPTNGTSHGPRGMPLDGGRRQTDVASIAQSLRG